MFISGTLGTVIGDHCSHNMGLDDAGASILLSPIVAVLFLAGRGGRLLLLPFYWLTVVLIRAAGTAVGDFISGRNMLGLPVSTAVTGALFIALLVIWREQSRSERERERERDRHRFLMRSALRHSAPRGRGAAHGAVRAVESRPVMPSAMMTGKCARREIIGAVVIAAVSGTTANRRTRSLQCRPIRGQPCCRRWPASIQNVQIGIIERERARLLDGGPYGPVRIEVVLRIIPGVV